MIIKNTTETYLDGTIGGTIENLQLSTRSTKKISAIHGQFNSGQLLVINHVGIKWEYELMRTDNSGILMEEKQTELSLNFTSDSVAYFEL